MILNWAKTRVALLLAGSHSNYPTYFLIGAGSGTVTASQTELFGATDRQLITQANAEIPFKVKYTGDWNSVELSGTSLQEWGLTTSGTGLTGSMWSKTVLPNYINFDGTKELRVEENWEVY